jgi:hypothetical protein
MSSRTPIYSDNYLRRNRLTGNLRRIRRILREIEEVQRLIPIIPEDETTDAVRKGMTIHYLEHGKANIVAARNQLVAQRDGVAGLRKFLKKGA